MLLKKKWAERFVQSCAKVRSTRRLSPPAGQTIYSTTPEGRCWVVIAGYVKILDPRPRLKRHLGARLGGGRDQAVLTFDSAALLARYGDNVRLSPLNSGCTRPPQPRGEETFRTLAD